MENWKEAYDASFVSELRPGVALSRNTVSKFLNDVGKRCTRITKFMKRRASRLGLDAKLLIDGTLKSDDSSVNPLKRNSKFIETHDLFSFEGILPGFEGVTFKKAQCQGVNKWLYAFRDTKLAAKEEKDWLAKNRKNGTYDDVEFKSKQRTFGTVVLESDKDMAPELAYRAYAERWQIEVVMKYCKSACEFE